MPVVQLDSLHSVVVAIISHSHVRQLVGISGLLNKESSQGRTDVPSDCSACTDRWYANAGS